MSWSYNAFWSFEAPDGRHLLLLHDFTTYGCCLHLDQINQREKYLQKCNLQFKQLSLLLFYYK